MSTEIYQQPEVICEVCGEVCDGYLIWEYPGSKYGWCMCDDCYNEAYETMVDISSDYRFNESFV